MIILWIGVAGALGALSRWLLSQWIHSVRPDIFPWGTLVCNLAGCLLLGYLTFVTLRRFSNRMKLALTTGFIGSFTTFSAFGVETVQLMEAGQAATALVYAAISLAVGLLLSQLGSQLGTLHSRQERDAHE